MRNKFTLRSISIKLYCLLSIIPTITAQFLVSVGQQKITGFPSNRSMFISSTKKLVMPIGDTVYVRDMLSDAQDHEFFDTNGGDVMSVLTISSTNYFWSLADDPSINLFDYTAKTIEKTHGLNSGAIVDSDYSRNSLNSVTYVGAELQVWDHTAPETSMLLRSSTLGPTNVAAIRVFQAGMGNIVCVGIYGGTFLMFNDINTGLGIKTDQMTAGDQIFAMSYVEGIDRVAVAGLTGNIEFFRKETGQDPGSTATYSTGAQIQGLEQVGIGNSLAITSGEMTMILDCGAWSIKYTHSSTIGDPSPFTWAAVSDDEAMIVSGGLDFSSIEVASTMAIGPFTLATSNPGPSGTGGGSLPPSPPPPAPPGPPIPAVCDLSTSVEVDGQCIECSNYEKFIKNEPLCQNDEASNQFYDWGLKIYPFLWFW